MSKRQGNFGLKQLEALPSHQQKTLLKTIDTFRVENWRRFSRHMEEYIGTWTVEKYTVEGSEGCDLMSITRDWKVCVWNILKYALRLWNGHAKDHDFEKMAHYCEMAWTATEGKVLVEEKEVETESEKESSEE